MCWWISDHAIKVNHWQHSLTLLRTFRLCFCFALFLRVYLEPLSITILGSFFGSFRRMVNEFSWSTSKFPLPRHWSNIRSHPSQVCRERINIWKNGVILPTCIPTFVKLSTTWHLKTRISKSLDYLLNCYVNYYLQLIAFF